ncbi:MAG: TetR/AcrR family transcriptional regulator, partial [Devosia sp.]
MGEKETTMARLRRAESQIRTSERLLKSALKAFVRDGYARASIDVIAEDAGYSKGAVYSNFAGKEGLFLAILKQKFETEIAGMKALAASQGSAEDILIAMLKSNNDRTDVLDFKLVATEFQTQVSRASPFAHTYAELFGSQRRALAELIATIFSRSGKQLPAPAEEIATGGIALTIGIAVQRGADPTAVDGGTWGRAID